MTRWNEDELNRMGGANELRIAATRRDGTPRPEVPIWVVRVGNDIVIRSWKGRGGAWFRSATASGLATVRAGGITREVRLEGPDAALRAAIDAAYRAKYGRGVYVDAMVTDQAASTSIALLPVA